MANDPTPTNSRNAEDERLDGWKRIAAYLNRDVRTVRRWEKGEGLPVRRLMHDKQATVYAFRSELDTWLEQRGQASDAALPEAKSGPGRSTKLSWVVALTVAVVVVAAVAWTVRDADEPTIVFGEWDWVMVTEFDNRTGEALLDGTVEYALQRELANSSLVKVAPPSRISEAFRLMKLPPETPLSVDTGREISLRDGGIVMLIAGRTEKLGSQYLLSAELVRPSDGVILASFSRDAAERDEILSKVGELAREVRTALGENLASVEESRLMLARVTTPSLEALKLYSEAERMMRGPDRLRAIAVLDEAVRIDPDFASAHLLLVYALQDADQMERADEHLRRAMELAEATSDQERLFILATYYFYYLNDYPKSIETYELLCRLFPGHPWANGNLANIYEWLGRFEDAMPFKRRLADGHPFGPWLHLEVAQIAVLLDDSATRDLYLGKVDLQPDLQEWFAAQRRFFALHETWVNGDLETLAVKLDERLASIPQDDLAADYLSLLHFRSLYLALGKNDRFRALSELQGGSGWLVALLDFDLGNPQTLAGYLDHAAPGYWEATFLALIGETERAREMIDDPRSVESLPPPNMLRSWKNLARGQLALAEGHYQAAIELLSDDAFLLSISNKAAHLFAMGSVAKAHHRLGEVESAIAVLESARIQKSLTIFEPGATWMWLRNQAYLHDLYLESGQVLAAENVQAELDDILRLADADHPLLPASNAVSATTQ